MNTSKDNLLNELKHGVSFKEHIYLVYFSLLIILFYSINSFLQKEFINGSITIVTSLFVVFLSKMLYSKNEKKKLFSRSLLYLLTNFLLYFYSSTYGLESGIYLHFFSTLTSVLLMNNTEGRNRVELVSYLLLTLCMLYLAMFFPFNSSSIIPKVTLTENIFEINLFATAISMVYVIYKFIVINQAFIKKLKTTVELERQVVVQQQSFLKEINHRVKNNLSIILALMRLEKNDLETVKDKLSFQGVMDRVFAMSKVHDLTYNKNLDMETIALNKYVSDLSQHLVTSFQADNKITLRLDLNSDTRLHMEKFMPLGLILNELITNSVKYAKKADGTLDIFISTFINENSFSLRYNDSGNKTVENIVPSVGLELIASLVGQLDGEYHIDKHFKYFFEFES